jgi:BASS family bile acid:Na+ symporter
MLSGVEKALLAVLLLVLMAGLGASLRPGTLAGAMRRPKGVIVGLLSQFGWMPAIGFGLAQLAGLPALSAIGLMVVACTPGGTTSNLFTYYARADVALSIAMTVVSSVVAVVVMPLLLVAYASAWTGEAMEVPISNIVTTLVLVLVPVAVGVKVRARNEEAAARLETWGSRAGIAVLILLIVTGVVRNLETIRGLTGSFVAVAWGLGALGMVLGWISARALGLGAPQRRAVAFETGIQNSPLALGIIALSFPDEQHAALMVGPMLYAVLVLVHSSLVVVWIRVRDRATLATSGAH